MSKKIIAIVAACVLALCLVGCDSGASKRSEEVQVENGRFLSDLPDCYVITDTETGVQYLFAKHSGGYAGYGGLTVLLNADGSPVIAEGYDHER